MTAVLDWNQLANLVGVLGFLLAMPLALFRLAEWIREPSFQPLTGRITIEHREQPHPFEMLGQASFTIAAFGGARTRRIIEWYWVIGYTENPKIADGRTQALNVLVPQRESVTFELLVPQIGLSVEPERKEIEVVFYLHVDRDWSSFRFKVYRHPNREEFVTDFLSTTLHLFSSHFSKPSLRRRLHEAILRRFR